MRRFTRTALIAALLAKTVSATELFAFNNVCDTKHLLSVCTTRMNVSIFITVLEYVANVNGIFLYKNNDRECP